MLKKRMFIVALVGLLSLVLFGGLLTMEVLLSSTPQTTSTQEILVRSRPLNWPEEHRTPLVPAGTSVFTPRPDRVALGPNVPTFTEEDVRSFIVRTNAMGLVEGLDTSRPITITKLEFLTERELRTRYGEAAANNSRPDDALLCYVELRNIPAVEGQSQTYTETACGRAFTVFDARTGNQLMFGVGCKQ